MKDFKIKVGDLVKLRDDLVNDKIYGNEPFINDMKFKGFKKIYDIDDRGSLLIYDENFDEYFFYTKEMLEEVKRPTYELIYKREEPILDDKEREYLSSVIRPFKKNILCIVKRYAVNDIIGEFLIIELNTETFDLPTFKKDTMYKNMELDKRYTLEELGL